MHADHKNRQIKFQDRQSLRYIILLSAGILMLNLFTVPGLRAENNNTGETVFLHTDKPYAVPSERIWFKAFIYSDKLSSGKTESTLLNILLVNPDNEIVLSGKYRITGNYADGCFDVPADLTPGIYCLLYYTNYMEHKGKNRKSKPFPVFDLYADYEKYTGEEVPARRLMAFYPENGILIADKPSKVVFSVRDSTDRPLDGKGVVYGNEGLKITEFSTMIPGLGFFEMIPRPDQSYTARFEDGRDSISFHLPVVYPEGARLVLDKLDIKELRFNVILPESEIFGLPDGHYLLAGKNKNSIFFEEPLSGNKNRMIYDIHVSAIPEGLNTFYLLDRDKNIVARRGFFRIPENILSVEIGTDKKEYIPGEEVFVKIRTTGSGGEPQGADLLVAVIDEQQFDADAPWLDHIFSDMFLMDHLGGPVTKPLGLIDPNWFSDSDIMDLYAIMAVSYEKEEKSAAGISGHMPESAVKKLLSLCGRVVLPLTGLPVPYQLILLSTDSVKPALQSVFADSDGFFCFEEFNEFTGETAINIQLIQETEYAELLVLEDSSVIYADTFHPAELSAMLKEYNIETTLPNSSKKVFLPDGQEIIYSLTSKPEIRLFLYPEDIVCSNFNYEISDMVTSKAVNYINSYRIRDLADRFYDKEITAHIFRDDILPPLYTRPDFSYNLYEYIAFESVSQLFTDLIGGISVRGRGDEQFFVTQARTLLFEGKPLILINGIPTFDATALLSLDPDIIKQIDILVSQETLMDFPIVCRNGVIAVYLRYEDFRFPESGSRKTINFKGLSETCIPDKVPPLEPDRYNRMPDLRPVLLWEPSVSTDENGEVTLSFRNSDDITNFRIIVQGLGHQGFPGYASAVFDVKTK